MADQLVMMSNSTFQASVVSQAKKQYTCRSFSCDIIATMLEDDNKRFSLASIVSSSNMAATSLSFSLSGFKVCLPWKIIK